MRELNDLEVENLGFLTRFGIQFGLLEPTATGLGKSIMDATADYRSFLLDHGIHDYEVQPQGPEAKRILSASIVNQIGEIIEASCTMYRPRTKGGDPRIWFSRLKQFCSPGDILVSLWSQEKLWVLNASKVNFSRAVRQLHGYRVLLEPLVGSRESVFEELLERLRDISARGYIPSTRAGDTGVGHLLETMLGIQANSSKAPDYKGVEIKSTRAGSTTRSQTLFAKVPNWAISELKSSREMLANFGYQRGDDFKLYCTVSSKNVNSQGLRLEVNEKEGLLHEISTKPEYPRPVSWRLQDLKQELAEKHADTFWVKASSRKEGGVESIHFHSVTQTTKPILQQMGPMLAAGSITVDHLIFRKGQRVSERGPLFKISKKHLDDLFPRPLFHDLMQPQEPIYLNANKISKLAIQESFDVFQ